MKLLAPTVLVSLALVVACIFGLFYLNDLHVEASDVLSENEKSTRVAMRLEMSARALSTGLPSSKKGWSWCHTSVGRTPYTRTARAG